MISLKAVNEENLFMDSSLQIRIDKALAESNKLLD